MEGKYFVIGINPEEKKSFHKNSNTVNFQHMPDAYLRRKYGYSTRRAAYLDKIKLDIKIYYRRDNDPIVYYVVFL